MLTLGQVRKVNRNFREVENSQTHLWPCCNFDFNLAERSIRKLRRVRAHGLIVECEDSYKIALESIASAIVNDARNW